MSRHDPDAPTLFDVEELTRPAPDRSDDGAAADESEDDSGAVDESEDDSGAVDESDPDGPVADGSVTDASAPRDAGDDATGTVASAVATAAVATDPAPISAAAHAPTSGRAPDAVEPDPSAVELVADAPERLRGFNQAGVLHPADVHTAVALCQITDTADPDVLLATALAVRGPRVGHVCVDLATVRDTVADLEDDPARLAALPWPDDLDRWVATVAGASGLVRHATGLGDDPDDDTEGHARPLTLLGTRLYLDRYWRDERRLATALIDRAARRTPALDRDRLRAGLDRLFGAPDPVDGPDLQRLAAATAVTRQLAVVAGGPGTGKTTTVARLLALLDEQAAATGAPAPRVALVAPTGKAAARLAESLREALERPDFRNAVDEPVRERLAAADASTIHRLLRRRPDNATRFRHHAGEPLPHDVVVVDEASMVSLALMSRLLDALAPSTRLVLVGDPQQLRSVEAGAVLGDIVGPALRGPRLSDAARQELAELTGEDLAGLMAVGTTAAGAAAADTTAVDTTAADTTAVDTSAAEAETTDPAAGPTIGDGIVVLQRVHRFGEHSGIARLAGAIQAGDADAVLDVLDDDALTDVTWRRRSDAAEHDDDADLGEVRRAVTDVFTRLDEAARDGRPDAALRAVEEVRVLCAHRRGPFGVTTWIPRVERWLGTRVVQRGGGIGWQVGAPVLATHNDHQLRIYNGDVGVVVDTDDGPRVAFPHADGPRLLPPGRLEGLEPVHAMTIHKSQGSQFRHAVVVLPGESSRILSRELFYTGVTRAQRQVTVVGSEAAVRAAVTRVVRRASGLRDRLWGPPDRSLVRIGDAAGSPHA
jgi:exodeoxyribonuclease V alpha subunit